MPVPDKRFQRAHAAAPALRLPARAHGQDDRAHGVHERRADAAQHKPALRLALAKGRIGIELDLPFSLGPLSLVELSLWFPKVRFPIDLSGGVPRFRHLRGELSKIAAELAPNALSSWAAPRLKGVLGPKSPDVFIAPIESGALFGLRSDDQALAFDLIVAPMERDLRLIPERARGVGLKSPPHLTALRVLHALGSSVGEIHGGALVISDAVARLVQHVLPNAGCRAPSVLGTRWSAPSVEIGRFKLEAMAGAPVPELSARAIRALELAGLSGDADANALAGGLDEARRKYVELLESAPKHREISERAAWIDALVGERAEAALSTLVDAVAAIDAGLVGGELLASIGDTEGAVLALSQAAALEPYSALAALTWMRAAALSEEQDAREHALNEAVVRAPLLESIRWARLNARLDRADVRGALADAEHLEACARGSEARHAVWRRTAEAFLERGFIADAEPLFERSLRYAPESEEAVLGLAKSLRAAGKAKRALDLFARAAALSDKLGRKSDKEHSITLELARTLVDAADDRPAAIARLRRIPPGLAESAEARFLEGKFRAELGDWAGSGEAFGRFRLEVERSIELVPYANEAWAYSVASMLLSAAHIEEEERGQLADAQRMLGLALRLKPRDKAIAAQFRRISQALRASVQALSVEAQTPEKQGSAYTTTQVSPMRIEDEEEAAESVPTAPSARSSQPFSELFGGEMDADGERGGEASQTPSVDELLIERLTARVRANPDDHEAVFALIDALSHAHRYLDLLALISARIEEGDDELRAALLPKKRDVLRELSAQARAAGRPSEAELYEIMAAGD